MDEKQLQEINEAFAAFKSANESYQAEVKKHGVALGETKAQVEKMQTALDQIEDKITKANADLIHKKDLEERCEELEALINRKGGGTDPGQKTEAQVHRDIFVKAIRTGVPTAVIHTVANSVLTDEEKKSLFAPAYMKALVLGSDVAGGYLAPLEYVNEMIKSVVEFSPVRGLARIRSTGRTGIQIPTRTTTAAATWVAETGTRSETQNPAFGMEEMRSHEMYAMVKVSRQELEDAAFDVEAFLREEFSEQFGLAEGTAFISGNANGKPEGMLANSAVAYVAGGHATEITADGLIALYFEPKEPYINSGTFLMSRPTQRTIRQLKDGNGNYLWSPGIKTDARPATILDRPYVTCPDMPSIGADTFPVIFGDIRRAYMILDRVIMEIMVDIYSSKQSGMVEISARKRVGGQVVLAEAIKKLKIATS